jgi:hypothetical protein
MEARATRVVISIFGILAGLAAIEHGIGEIGRDRHIPHLADSVMVRDGRFAILAGEPALTVLPNLVFSGARTVIIALVFAIWSVACSDAAAAWCDLVVDGPAPRRWRPRFATRWTDLGHCWPQDAYGAAAATDTTGIGRKLASHSTRELLSAARARPSQ